MSSLKTAPHCPLVNVSCCQSFLCTPAIRSEGPRLFAFWTAYQPLPKTTDSLQVVSSRSIQLLHLCALVLPYLVPLLPSPTLPHVNILPLSSNNGPRSPLLCSVACLNFTGNGWKGWKTRMKAAFCGTGVCKIIVDSQQCLPAGTKEGKTAFCAAWDWGMQHTFLFVLAAIKDNLLKSIDSFSTC